MSIKKHNLKGAVATLKTTKNFEFKIAQFFCIQIFLIFFIFLLKSFQICT